MLELGTSGSVGGEGGNLLVYPASVGQRVPKLREPAYNLAHWLASPTSSRKCGAHLARCGAAKAGACWRLATSKLRVTSACGPSLL